MENYSEEDSTPAIQKIIDEGYRVMLKRKIYIVSSPIILKNHTWIEGQGEASIIMAKDESKCNIMETDLGTEVMTLKNFKIDGNLLNQTGENGVKSKIYNLYGILIDTYDRNTLNSYYLSDLTISNIGGTALKINCRGKCDLNNIKTIWSRKSGIDIYTFDSSIYNIDCSSSEDSCIVCSGANNKYLNIKGWYGLEYGMTIKSNRSMFKNIEVQDCLKGGIRLIGNNNNIQGIIDSVGQAGKDTYQDNTASLLLSYNKDFPYTNGNIVDLYVIDKEENTKPHDGHGNTDYLIQIVANNQLKKGDYSIEHITGNSLLIGFQNVRKGIFKDDDSEARVNKNNKIIIDGVLHNNTRIDRNMIPYINGTIELGNIVKCDYQELHKMNGVAYINFEVVLGEAKSYGTIIGKLPLEFYPQFSRRITTACISDTNKISACTITIKNNGDIIIDKADSDVYKIVLSCEYLCRG